MNRNVVETKVKLGRIINNWWCPVESVALNNLINTYFILEKFLLNEVPQLKTEIERLKETHEYADNIRFCDTSYADDVQYYEECKARGCCGYVDEQLVVDGRVYLYGCNYGH